MIAHIVLFEPKAGLDQSQKLAFAQSVIETCRSIETVRRLSVGRRVEIDPGYGRSLGDTTYKYAAVLEFDGAEGLVGYLNDPKHEVLGRLFWEYCERAIVSEVEWVDVDAADAANKLAF
ncbi:MAG TPA: Dabb family protein [Vicinamibacterales bacterium]|jgi:hypothetical protein|nr:Dabb family protein [Vicinamibacterales bacterium]